MRPIIALACRSGRLGLMFMTLILSALPLDAQFVPGPYYYPDAGVMGTVSSAYQSAAQQRAYADNRQMQMQSSMARSAAWQNINRSMQAEAASRTAAVPDAGQAARLDVSECTALSICLASHDFAADKDQGTFTNRASFICRGGSICRRSSSQSGSQGNHALAHSFKGLGL